MHEKYNQSICELHAKFGSCFRRRIPAFYGAFKKGGLLCVGINPSFSNPGSTYKMALKWNKCGLLPVKSADECNALLKSKELTADVIEKALQLEALFAKHYPYFKKFREISQSIGLDYQHIDVIPIRDANQKRIESLYRDKREFFAQTIQIFLPVLEWVRPKIILVQNAFAAKILNEFAPLTFPSPREENVDEELGTPLTAQRIPIFYTSMLTGQRALDCGSFARLVWHMKYVLSKQKARENHGKGN